LIDQSVAKRSRKGDDATVYQSIVIDRSTAASPPSCSCFCDQWIDQMIDRNWPIDRGLSTFLLFFCAINQSNVASPPDQ